MYVEQFARPLSVSDMTADCRAGGYARHEHTPHTPCVWCCLLSAKVGTLAQIHSSRWLRYVLCPAPSRIIFTERTIMRNAWQGIMPSLVTVTQAVELAGP